MEITAIVASFLAVVLGVISLTVMVLDTVNRQSLEKKMKIEKKAFEEAVKGLGVAHDNVVKGMNEMSEKLETAELQIKSLTLGTQAPRRGF